MKTKVFISRELGLESAFREKIDERQVKIIDELLIEFSPIPFEDIHSEWIFFYSKTGIDYYLCNKNHVDHPKVAAFGPATAEHFTHKTGIKVDFTGSGERHDVAEKFKLEEGYESCLFIVGKNSFRSVQKILNIDNHQEIVVYDNTPKMGFKIEEPSLAVFTSPMAVETYFTHYPDRSHPNIAIGNTTAKTISDMGYHLASIADVPSESSLADAANSYLNNFIY